MGTIDGVTWVMLVDGLGHGPEAAEVARQAVDEHGRFTAELSVKDAFARLHDRLDGSRGAAATIVRFSQGSLSVGGVGNVMLRTLQGPSVPFIGTNGILGGTLGGRVLRVRVDALSVSGSGRLLLFTDGIVRTAPLRELASLDAEALCRTLVEDHSIERDDATVIDVAYRSSSDPDRA